MRSRATYSSRVGAPKLPAIDERSWEIFAAYCYKQRTFDQIAEDFHLSSNQVRRVVTEVDAQLGSIRDNSPKRVALESPVEDLGLSVRTLNALHSVGCHTVEDALHLNLSSSVRGLGRKTKSELITSLERAGYNHPSLEDQPRSEIRILEQSLERMQNRLERTVTLVAKEIRFVRERLHKKVAPPAGKKKAVRPPAPTGQPVDDFGTSREYPD